MNTNLMASFRHLLANPNRFHHDALFAVLNDDHASEAVACLAPPGTLAQIAAAMHIGWSWDCDGWKQKTDELLNLIIDPHCTDPKQIITTWSRIPNAVGVLRDRNDDRIAWALQVFDPWTYTDLAILLGPSDESARLLMRSPTPYAIGTTLRHWSMAIDPDDPTAWQAMIDPNLRTVLHQRADPSRAFPAWGWDAAVDPGVFLREIVDDLAHGWSPDHPSLRRRIGWIEHHVDSNLHIGYLAVLASIGRSDALAEAVCARIGQEPWRISFIADNLPWSRLHPRIQDSINEAMHRASDDQLTRTWATTIRQAQVVNDATIDSHMILWRIDQEWRDAHVSNPRADLSLAAVSPPIPLDGSPPPDLVAGKSRPNGRDFRVWKQNVPPDDLRALDYADLLSTQSSLKEVRMLFDLLMMLPPDRRTRFEQIIDWRLVGRSEPTDQPPWDWADWAALPAADRPTRLRDRLAVLWGDGGTLPAVRFWRARNNGFATVAVRVSEVLGIDDPSPILAALLAQIPSLRRHVTDVGPPLPFPADLTINRRDQIEQLPLTPDAQAYAAWCLRFFDQDRVLGGHLMALYPAVASALEPILNPKREKQRFNPPRIQVIL